VIIQRVKSASVTVDEELISSIGKGLLVLTGVGKEDTEKEAENIVNKVLKAKFWPDEKGSQVRMRVPPSRLVLTGNSSGRRTFKKLRARYSVVSPPLGLPFNGLKLTPSSLPVHSIWQDEEGQ
jgi:hypothetical protein